MRHVILIRSAYGPVWDFTANQRRLAMTEGVTIRSLASQSSRDFDTIVLLDPRDALLEERKAAFDKLNATFRYLEATGSPSEIAFRAYSADWDLGSRDGKLAMTRLDDDDAFAPWAMTAVRQAAEKVDRRTVLMFPLGVRVYQGGYTLVRHTSNAMHTLVTPPGDSMDVYDYGHRNAKKAAPVRIVDNRPAWLWARHQDTISGWRTSARPLIDDIRDLFDVDWSLFGPPQRQPRVARSAGGYVFR